MMFFLEYICCLKNMLFASILLYASVCDIRTRIIPDKIHVAIIFVALIQINWISSMAAFFLVPMPLLIVGILGGNIGGGDIKLVAACSFFLGYNSSLKGLIIGMTIAIMYNFGYTILTRNNLNKTIALVPYLSVGFVLSML